MTRIGRIVVSCALAALLAGCNDLPAAFEDVGNDPHPPSLTLVGIGLEPVGGDPENPPPVSYVPPAAGITVNPHADAAKTLAFRVSYADAGADLDSVVVRDVDGPISGTLTLPDVVGGSGTFEATLDVPETAAAGQHQVEIWAQDANGSRSAKTSFTVTVQLF
jgi:hypothetical protein